MNIFSDTTIDRFWEKVEVLGEDECWCWQGAQRNGGYGHLYVNGRWYGAHRISYEINIGPIGALCVLHSCDNPQCCNPNHLWLGTQTDNMVDRDMKGRNVPPPSNSRVLTQEQANEIREKYIPRVYLLRRLAEEYNVDYRTIWNVIHYIKGYEA